MDMGSEREMRVESASQYAGCLFKRLQGVVQSDLKMSVRLCKLRSEMNDSGLWSRHG